MELQYTGYTKTQVKVEIDEKDLATLTDIVYSAFIDHITYGSYSPGDGVVRKAIPNSVTARVIRFCEAHGIDWEFPKERVAFFKAILDVK